MKFETIDTGVIDPETLPWTPYVPYSPEVLIKLLKADPVRGEFISFLKAPVDMELPKHHHSGTVIVYTVKGAWKYKEHDWVATPGSVVFETAASSHTPIGVSGYGDEIITFNINVGDLIYCDANDTMLAKENWRTAVARYLDYCKEHNLTPVDVTSFDG
ncbi:2,4'-dihydroxyacetophenone dioxygenase family protein [Pseudokordiimonas caeni]|uniref:2,4'-dihydroxyacetophenone dioxygenase family protein n=1 Tax=Pseudokordiimonas caeni TaxID=2997908 RepID=UPI0035935C87